MTYGLNTRVFIEDGPVAQVANADALALNGPLVARLG